MIDIINSFDSNLNVDADLDEAIEVLENVIALYY